MFAIVCSIVVATANCPDHNYEATIHISYGNSEQAPQTRVNETFAINITDENGEAYYPDSNGNRSIQDWSYILVKANGTMNFTTQLFNRDYYNISKTAGNATAANGTYMKLLVFLSTDADRYAPNLTICYDNKTKMTVNADEVPLTIYYNPFGKRNDWSGGCSAETNGFLTCGTHDTTYNYVLPTAQTGKLYFSYTMNSSCADGTNYCGLRLTSEGVTTFAGFAGRGADDEVIGWYDGGWITLVDPPTQYETYQIWTNWDTASANSYNAYVEYGTGSEASQTSKGSDGSSMHNIDLYHAHTGTGANSVNRITLSKVEHRLYGGDVFANYSVSMQSSVSVSTVVNISVTLNSTNGTLIGEYDNLTSWISTAVTGDLENSTITNITNWYKNNKSFTSLLMPFDEGSNTSQPDYSGHGNDGGVIGGAYWNSTDCVYGGCFQFNGSNGLINVSGDGNLNITENLSVFVWVKSSNTEGNVVISKWDIGPTARSWMIRNTPGASNGFSVYLSDDGSTGSGYKLYSSSLPVFDGSWHQIGFTFSSNTLKVYRDGVYDPSVTKTSDSDVISLYGSNISVCIGCYLNNQNPTSLINGLIDEIMIFDTNLTAKQIRHLHYDTLNGTPFNTLSSEYVDLDGSFFHTQAYVIGQEGLINTTNSSTFHIDTVDPLITVNASTSFSVDNLTIIDSRITNLTLNLTFEDVYLFQVAVNITDKDNRIWYFHEELDLNVTQYSLEEIYYTGNWSIGNYTVNIKATDDHTKKQIKAYGIKHYVNAIEFDTEEKNKIRVLSADLDFSGAEAEKKKDRYKIKTQYNKPKKKFTFIVSEENGRKIYERPFSDYPGHLVIWNPETNTGNWIDFDMPDNMDKVEYSRLPSGDYKIIVHTLKATDKLEFNSIGGTNSKQLKYSFYVTNSYINATANYWNYSLTNFSMVLNGTTYYSDTALGNISASSFPIDVLETQMHNVTFSKGGFDDKTIEINVTANYNAYLNYSKYLLNITSVIYGRNGSTVSIYNITATAPNGTNYTANTTNGTLLIELDPGLNYTVKVDKTNYSFTSKTVLMDFWFKELNFSIYNLNSITFSFKDEKNASTIDEVDVELITDGYANNHTSTNGSLYLQGLSNVEHTIRYTAVGYLERFYYFNLQNRTHTNITLFLVHNSSATQVTATVSDEADDELEGVYIKALRYDLDTNSYIIREIAKTNFEGEAVLSLVLNDEFYQFILEYPLGDVKKITIPTYIFGSTLEFQILLGNATAANFYNSQDINSQLIFNNATNNFRWTYSDANNIVTQGCIRVYQISASGKELYNQSCVESTAATLLIPVSNTTGRSYTASTYVYFGDEEYFLESLIKKFEESISTGKLGIFLIWILTFVFIFIGYWDKAVALILAPIPLVIGTVINLIDINWGIALGIWIVCMWVASMISSNKK